MKVRVVLVVDVDEAAWRAEYDNPEMTQAEIRLDVRSSIGSATSTEGVIAPAGLIRDVTVEGIA